MISIEGFVLAGGRSRRMGHNKANLLLGGTTLAERAAKTLSIVANPVFLVGNFEIEYTSLPIIADEPVGNKGRGAIIGLYTALLHAKTEWAAVLACDLPFVSGELLTRMASLLPQFADSPEDEAGAVLAEQPDGRLQPLCGLYRRHRCLPEVEKMLSEDNWRLQGLPDRIGAFVLRFHEISDMPNASDLFMNVNTPEDYKAALLVRSVGQR